MPKVTVLMAVYNGERHIFESVESILNQTFRDFEFIIINDGSTDTTREIILSFKDSRIRLVDNKQNLGLTRSLNKGFQIAKGKFLARQDADDLSEPERLARQVAFLEANSEIALVGSWCQGIDEEGNVLGKYTLPCDFTQIRWGLLFYTPFFHSSVIFRRTEVLQKVGLYNEEYVYAQDHEFWVRIAQIYPVANLDQFLVKYRVHASSITLLYETRQYELLFQSCHAYMTTLLKCSDFANVIDQELFRSMQFLLNYSQDQDSQIFELKKLGEVIQIIFQLSQTFYDYYHLGNSEIKNHHSTLVSTVSKKLINLASDYSAQNRQTSWKLLTQAYLVNQSLFFTKKYQTTLLKSLMGSSVLSMIRRVRLNSG